MKRPWKDTPKVFLLTASAFALEVSFTVTACYALPVLLGTGFQLKYASMLWGVPPVLGFLAHGYVGSASDRCKCSWGRRRPFILVFALIGGTSIAMFAYGKPLAEKWLRSCSGFSLYMYMYPVAFVFMTFSLDILDSLVRMYLLDSVPLESSDKANYIYSSMVALGAMFGSLVASVDWPGFFNSAISRSSKDATTYQMQIVVGIALTVFVVCVSITLCSVKEQGTVNCREYDVSNGHSTSSPKSKVWIGAECIHEPAPLNYFMRDGKLQSEPIPSYTHSEENTEVDRIPKVERYICCSVEDIFESIRGTWEFIKHLSNPTLLLLLMTLLDWFVLHTLIIFFSDYVGEVVYGGSPSSDKPELTSMYLEGVQMSGRSVMIEDLAMFVYSLLLERMSTCVSHRYLLLCGHLMFSISLGITIFSQSIPTLFAMAVAEGVIYGNLYSIPYSLIQYYEVGHVSDENTCMCMYMHDCGLYAQLCTIILNQESCKCICQGELLPKDHNNNPTIVDTLGTWRSVLYNDRGVLISGTFLH